MFVKLGASGPAQEARNQSSQGLANDQSKGLFMMAADQRFECGLDSLHGLFDGLALGRTDGHGVFDPLAKQLGVSAFDLLDLKSLPEPSSCWWMGSTDTREIPAS